MIQVNQIDKCVGDILRHPCMYKNYKDKTDLIELRRIVANLVRESYWEGFHTKDQESHCTVILNTIDGKHASKWERDNEKQKKKKRRLWKFESILDSLSLEDLENLSFKAKAKLFFRKEVKEWEQQQLDILTMQTVS